MGMRDDAAAPRRASQDREGFLLALSDALRPLSDPMEIQAAAARVLGEHLAASRALYSDVESEEGRHYYFVRQDYHPPGHTSLVGRFAADDFGLALFYELRAGRTAVVHDVAVEPMLTAEEREAYEAAGMRAFIGVPLVKDGRPVAFMSLQHAVPRAWTAGDVALVEETAERTWAAVVRARAEEALRASEEQYRTLFESIDEGFSLIEVMYDTAGKAVDCKIVEVNPAQEKMSGIRLVPGQTVRGVVPSIADHRIEIYAQVALTGEPTRFETYVPETDRWFTVYALRVGGEGSRKVAVLFNDISARRTADRILRESEERQAFLLKLSDALRPLADPLQIQKHAARVLGDQLDTDWTCYAEHDAAVTMATVHRDHVRRGAPSLVGRHALDEFPGILAAIEAGRTVAIEDTAASSRASDVDRSISHGVGLRSIASVPVVKDGTAIASLVVADRRPRAWSAVEISLMEATADRTWAAVERARADDALRQSEAQLREADRRKDEFLAVLAHELRNPLAPIRTGLELLRLSGDTPDSVERVRTMMERQVGHMIRLIDDLLDVSRITSGKIRLQRQPARLVTLINTAIEANRAALGAKQIVLDLDMPDSPVALDVDPTRFVQVVSNVLHNATKFTPRHGRVRLAAKVDPREEGVANQLVLTVTDSGIGISRDLLPRVFDLFSQGDVASQGAPTGLGIGLALAHRLMEMHGGTVEAQSDGPDRGSTFTIRLPISTSASRPTSATVSVPPREIRRRVVVIDDNEDAADALAMLVSALGGESRVAYDGRKGLALVREFRPDVVFLDIGMPGIDGYETCRRIREAVGSDVIIVALTGWGQEQDRRSVTQAGFDTHLTKPADPATLECLLADAKPARQVDR